jgi:nitroreductase
MQTNATTPSCDHLCDNIANRMSSRRLKPDPFPEDYVRKILEAGRLAMSGANSQPWEFIVVKDEGAKCALFEVYRDVNSDFIFCLEQMRERPLRQPACQVGGDNPKEQWERARTACPARGLWRPPDTTELSHEPKRSRVAERVAPS